MTFSKVKKASELLTFILLIGLTSNTSAAVDENIASIRYQITAIEHQFKSNQKKEKVKILDQVIDQAQKVIDQNSKRPEGFVWKGIALSVQAKHKAKGLDAIKTARLARLYLEKAIDKDSMAVDPMVYNTLGMLYCDVPRWPIGFGNKKKAEKYFQKAMLTSSNLDTNYRYGAFLVTNGDKQEGFKYLEKALSFPNRQGHKEDALKKQDIRELISQHKVE